MAKNYFSGHRKYVGKVSICWEKELFAKKSWIYDKLFIIKYWIPTMWNLTQSCIWNLFLSGQFKKWLQWRFFGIWHNNIYSKINKFFRHNTKLAIEIESSNYSIKYRYHVLNIFWLTVYWIKYKISNWKQS